MKITYLLLLIFLSSCKQDVPLPEHPVYKTKNIFIVVMDGARYSETWGEPLHVYIPQIHSLSSQGTVCMNFLNNGQTVTVPGHVALSTGVYQNINNGGLENPSEPSLFQYYRAMTHAPETDTWIFASKDKLEVLSDCTDPDWKGQYRPRADCGVNGNFSGFREDSVTYRHLIDTAEKYHPHLVLVNFKQPDVAGHSNNWLDYINQIKNVDNYVGRLWDFLQNDSFYKNTTTLFVTNDHGRHLDDVAGGFVSHGDGCYGCRHLLFFGIGPDLKTNFIDSSSYSLIDLFPTAGELLGIDLPTAEGKVMSTILR